jgi:hypothetical protein
METVQQFEAFAYRVASKSNIHHHSFTCRKGGSGRTGCRMGIPYPFGEGKLTRPMQLTTEMTTDRVFKTVEKEAIDPPAWNRAASTYLDEPIAPTDARVIVWEHQRQSESDGRTVTFSPIATGSLTCNTAMYPLFGTHQAKSAAYYLTEYITKDSGELTNILPLMYEAQKHVAAFPSIAVDSGTETRTTMHYLSSLLNRINGMQEISTAMIAYALLGHKPHARGFDTWYCFINPAIRFVKERLGRNGAWDESEFGQTEMMELDVSNNNSSNSNDDNSPTDFYEDQDVINIFRGNTDEEAADGHSSRIFVCENGERVIVNQFVHYGCRGPRLELLDVYEYSGQVEIADREPNQNSNCADTTAASTTIEEEESTERRGLQPGRKPQERIPFTDNHPLHTTLIQIWRDTTRLVILAGRAPPPYPGRLNPSCENWRSEAQRFVEYYSTLLIPWDLVTMAPPALSWPFFTDWIARTATSSSVIDRGRLNLLKNCCSSLRVNSTVKRMTSQWKNRHAARWAENDMEAEPNAGGRLSRDALDDDFNANDEASYERIIQDLRNLSRTNETESDKVRQYLENTTAFLVKIFDDVNTPSGVPQQLSAFHSQPLQLFEDVHHAETVSTAIKCKTNLNLLEIREDAENQLNSNSNIETGTIGNFARAIESSSTSNVDHSLIDEEEDNDCNAEQNRALTLITSYQNRVARGEDPEATLFLVTGGPGVGKSFFAQKLSDRYKAANQKVICGAPTGAAASCIPGTNLELL